MKEFTWLVIDKKTNIKKSMNIYATKFSKAETIAQIEANKRNCIIIEYVGWSEV